MGEGWNPSAGCAWGCTNPVGWVPFPKKLPRRNPLLDSVGRIDDPCARPAYHAPNYAPTPKFKGPREGYPNDMCNLDDYEDQKYAEETGALATINLAKGTAAGGVTLRVKPMMTTDTVMAEPPTIEDCCKDSRDLSVLKQEVNSMLGPSEKEKFEYEMMAGSQNQEARQTTQGQGRCGSSSDGALPDYPCRGVIKPPRPAWPKQKPGDKCKPSAVSTRDANPDDDKPLTGREFVEGMRTCDLYPIHKNLPGRFNNSEWFKGYGCERQAHPFYQTTQQDYFRFPPTAHTMTQAFYPLNCKFTDHLAKTGMPRNRSLNLMSNKSVV